MKNIIFHSFLLLTSSLTFGQVESKTYLTEGRTFEILKKYSVNEITIFSDSTYIQKVYKLDNKEQRKNYRDFEYNLLNGKFKKNADYYIFREIGADSVFKNHFKITDKKLTYYYRWKEKNFKKGGVFKRVDSDNRRTVDFIREITDYVYFRNIDKGMNTSITEGEIEYGENLENIGGFEYYEHFYPDTKELIRIDYSANTKDELSENYYFKNSKLIYVYARIQQSSGGVEIKKLYINDGEILYQSKSDYFKTKDLIQKGHKYLTDWKASL